MGAKISNYAYRLFNARYGLPSWILASLSMMVGILVVTYLWTKDPEVLELLDPLPLDGWIWGPLLIVSAGCAMVGMARYNLKLVRYGSFASFVAWCFGTFAFALGNDSANNILILSLPMLTFWTYKYIASYLRENTHSF